MEASERSIRLKITYRLSEGSAAGPHGSMQKVSPGFTLFEIILVVALTLIFFTITSPKLSRVAEQRTEARAAAMLLAEDLRYARERAIFSRSPVAVIIPNAGLTIGHCQGYLMKEGLIGTKTTKVVDLSKLYHQVSLFVGTWDIDLSRLHDPSLATSGNALTGIANTTGFDVSLWGGKSNDYIFLFTPEGAVAVNPNMPHFDNTYHIVAGEFFTYTVTAPPGSSTSPGSLTSAFKLREISPPAYTITITPSGEISLSDGVTALSSSSLASSPPQGPGRGAPLPSVGYSQHSPALEEVTLYPKINRGIYPESTGIDAVVEPAGHLKIVMTARDQDGDQLYLKTEITSGVPEGTLSTSLPVLMEYNAPSNLYTGIVEWFPPVGAAPGSRFTISLTVDDGKYPQTTTKHIQISGLDRIAFLSDRDGSTGLYIMNTDGTEITRLPFYLEALYYRSYSFNSDSTKITFIDHGDMEHSQVWLINTDLTNLLDLTVCQDHPSSSTEPVWSPDGTKIAFAANRWTTDMSDIFVMNADGSHPVNGAAHSALNITKNLGNGDDHLPAWSPDGKKMAFSRGSISAAIYTLDVSDLNEIKDLKQLSSGQGDWQTNWSPDGKNIAFSSTRDNELYKINLSAPGTEIRLTDSPISSCPSWSPDSGRLVFETSRDGNTEIYIMNADGSNQVNLTNKPAAADKSPMWIRL